MQYEIVGFKKYIEIENWRSIGQKGNANFALVIYPEGEKILDCSYINHEKGTFWTMPQKTIEKDGKKEYLPYVSYKDKAYKDALRAAVLAAVQQKAGESNGKASHPRQNGSNEVQSESPPLW